MGVERRRGLASSFKLAVITGRHCLLGHFGSVTLSKRL